MKLLTDDVLLGSSVNASAIGPLEEEIKGDRTLTSLRVNLSLSEGYSLSAIRLM